MQPQCNYKLTIAYDGTNYCGWQIQPNGLSIQASLEAALKTILREPVQLIGSGRTDSGVHAHGQVAHFKFHESLHLYRLRASLNGLVPRDIRVLGIEEVPLDFHAQYSALGKIYHYHLFLEKVQDPFKRLYSYHVREKIDVALLKEAASHFLGTHDFTSFANEGHAGSASQNPVRTLSRLDLVFEPGGVRLEFEGNGFLYKMVRNITGTLLEVAAGKREIKEIEAILAAKDRKKAGAAVPPLGLFLVEVKYPLSLLKKENAPLLEL